RVRQRATVLSGDHPVRAGGLAGGVQATPRDGAAGHVVTDRDADAVTRVLEAPHRELLVGGSQQFAVWGLKNTGDSVSVSVSYNVTGGTISGGGLYTAGQTAGAYRVVARQNGGPLADT